MLCFALFFLLLRLSLSAQYKVRCHPPSPPASPRAEDCRYLLAHLPSNPIPSNIRLPLLFSLSLPFQPYSYLQHNTCAAEFHYFSSDATTDAQVKALQDDPPTMELFDVIKIAGGNVVDRCLESGHWRGGTARGQIKGLGWVVSIAPRLTDAWWARMVSIQRGAMMGVLQAMPVLPDPWGFGVWEV